MKNIHDDIKELDEKIKKLDEKEHETVSRKEVYPLVGAAVGMGFKITVELVSGVIIGAGLGYLLDMLFDTAPAFLALFLLLGGSAGFLNVYRIIKDDQEKNEKEEK